MSTELHFIIIIIVLYYIFDAFQTFISTTLNNISILHSTSEYQHMSNFNLTHFNLSNKHGL